MSTTLNKIRNSSFITGAGVYFVSNILNAAIPFALLPILTRYLDPSEYGQVAMFQILLGALSAFIGISFVGAASRKYYDANLSASDLSKFVGVCLQLILASSLIALVVLFLLQEKLSKWVSLDPKYIIWAVFVSFGGILIQLRLGQWQVRKEAVSYGVLQVSQSIFNMLLSLIFVVALLQGAEGRIDAQILVTIIFSLLSLALFKRDRLFVFFCWSPKYLKEAMKFGLPLIPHLAGTFLLTSVDRFVINQELGLVEAGIYMVAVQLTSAMGIVFDAINKAYIPWLYEHLKGNEIFKKCQIVRMTYLWYSVILLGVAFSFLIGNHLVIWIAGEKYARAGEVFGWLALGQGLQGMYLMMTNYIFYSKKTGVLSFVSIGSGVFNVLLLLFLIQEWALSGAAIAFAISMGVRFLLTWWVAQIRHPMPWFSFLNVKGCT
ncbi:lipopolysaccharide biosynthesis protein [Zobellella maritima]|uniref:lipopolysaccharide biosynthesis protein n=1 Tax=Zobellella maritima TaxID=2059725 RepID=UPI000E30AFFD|nr:oligosaccharide flippase family protein [Zobellella maritima]